MMDLPTIEVSGTVDAMGEALGEGLRTSIGRLLERRRASALEYQLERGLQPVDMSALGDDCLHVLRGWDPAGHAEHLGVARGAHVDPAELYALVNLTDSRDLACLGAQADAEGCTVVMVPPAAAAEGRPLAGQTWDLVAGDVEDVVAVHRRPDDGPATWSVTVAGAPSLMGMNETGLAAGTTNIKVAGARVGVGYMSLLHRALGCSDRREASACITGAPRIGAHTYWLADNMGVLELECDSLSYSTREAADQPLVRTNHCLHKGRTDAEPATDSSLARLESALSWARRRDITVEQIRTLLGDRSDGLCSINRRHDDGEPTATNACVIADPAGGVLHACRGEADRGVWLELTP